MNNTFNIQRLGLLLKRQWLEFGKIYLITLAVALGVIITFYGFLLSSYFIYHSRQPDYYSLNFREPLFLIFGFLFITIIASSYFAHLGQKPKATIDLMIPASTFEKFLTSIFFTVFLSIVSYIIIFYLTDLVFISKLRGIYDTASNVAFNTDTGGKIKSAKESLTFFFTEYYPKEFKSIYVITPFFVTSVFLLGSIYFNKYHYIKTAITVMVFSGIWAWIMVKSAEAIFSGRINNNIGFLNFGKTAAEIGVFLILLVLTLIFWTITYTRLKEKQI